MHADTRVFARKNLTKKRNHLKIANLDLRVNRGLPHYNNET